MKSLLLDLYSRIASKLRAEHPEEVKIQDENLILLNAQILSRFGHSGSVVDELPSVFHRNALPSYLAVTFDQGEWRLSGAGEAGDHIYSSTRLARVAAWLIHNQLWRSKSNLHFQPFDRPVKKSALLHLLDELSHHFRPLNIGHMRDKNLLAHPEGPGILVVNLEEGNTESGLFSAELVYRTSLGEMCHEVFHFPALLTDQEKYYQLAQFYWAGTCSSVVRVSRGRPARTDAGNNREKGYPGIK